MKTSIKFSSILVTLASIILFSACSGEKESTDKKEKTEIKKEEIVKVLSLEETNITRSLKLSSVLEAYEKVAIAPSMPGRIDKIFVEVGSRVSNNQLLAQMDQSNYIQAKLAFENLKVNFDRVSALNESNNISKQTYDQTKAQYDIQKESLDNLASNTFLRAPFSGVIAEKKYENGELYNGQQPILSLIEISTLKSYINIPETYYPLIKEGMNVHLFSDTYPNKSFVGKIEKVYPTIDPSTHSFQAKLKIANAKEVLRPGMFCRVNLDLENVNTIVIPSQAILKTQGSNERYIFVNDNGIAKRIVVTIGERYDEKVEINSNEIKKGDQIVIAGQARLKTGDKLKIVE